MSKDVNEIREYLEKVENKLEQLTEVVEVRLLESDSKTRFVDAPKDIEVDLYDEYNTQPTQSLFYNYGRNYRMFRKSALKQILSSKIFWLILVLFPLSLSFVQYFFFCFIYDFKIIHDGGIQYILAVLINHFFLSPLLLFSLILFPSIIVVAREDNNIKRYMLLGMNRKQIYYAYMRFTITFLALYVLFMFGPWFMFLNFSMDRIFLSNEQIENGRHVLQKPWGVFIGMEFSVLNPVPFLDIRQYTWVYNKELIINAIDNNESFSSLQFIMPMDLYDLYVEYVGLPAQNALTASYEEQIETLDEINKFFYEISQYTYINSNRIALNYEGYSADQIYTLLEELTFPVGKSLNKFILYFDTEMPFVRVSEYNGMGGYLFFVMYIIAIFGINSIGYQKAMKVSSTREVLNWGIGIWIFSWAVQITTPLVYKEVYVMANNDKLIWFVILFALLFAAKWVFLLSPITIITMGMILVSGYVEQPIIQSVPIWSEQYKDFYYQNAQHIYNYFPTLYYFISNINQELRTLKEYSNIVDPQIIKNLYVLLSISASAFFIIGIWSKKEKILSVEVSR